MAIQWPWKLDRREPLHPRCCQFSTIYKGKRPECGRVGSAGAETRSLRTNFGRGSRRWRRGALKGPPWRDRFFFFSAASGGGRRYATQRMTIHDDTPWRYASVTIRYVSPSAPGGYDGAPAPANAQNSFPRNKLGINLNMRAFGRVCFKHVRFKLWALFVAV